MGFATSRMRRVPPRPACGQSLVVWAIPEGRRAARGVDKYLMYGETVLP
jgi:NADPH-dependent glutamate synthase beta subunit-like oxidoreductase